MSDQCQQLMTVSGSFHFWIGKVLAEVTVGAISIGICLIVLLLLVRPWRKP